MLDSRTGGDSDTVSIQPSRICSSVSMSSRGPKTVQVRELTERQREVLDAIRAHVRRHGIPPSRAELAAAVGLKHDSAVDKHLTALAKKGWIERERGMRRGLRLVREGAPILDPDQLPTVSAGTPIVAEESASVARLADMDAVMEQFEAKPDFFVRVQGDSLDKMGFKTGDIVAVRRDPEPREGHLVVARIGVEVTLKRYHRTGTYTFELQPQSSNPEHEPIQVDTRSEDFEIVGIVVGAIIGTPRVPNAR